MESAVPHRNQGPEGLANLLFLGCFGILIHFLIKAFEKGICKCGSSFRRKLERFL